MTEIQLQAAAAAAFGYFVFQGFMKLKVSKQAWDNGYAFRKRY